MSAVINSPIATGCSRLLVAAVLLVAWACGGESSMTLSESSVTVGTLQQKIVGTPPPVSVYADLPSEETGFLSGSGAVAGDGSYIYSMPIPIPEGRAGMQPNLSFEYRSSANNGPLGVGWSLSGLSSITRCPKIYASGGLHELSPGAFYPTRATEGVQYDTRDSYCLDGLYLELVEGEYGAPGSVYVTEVETFARVILETVAPDLSPTLFTVYQKNGQIARYEQLPGRTLVSRRHYVPCDGCLSPTTLEHGEANLIWPITSLRDRSGNEIAFEWLPSQTVSESSGELYTVGNALHPHSISYTRHVGGAQPYGAQASRQIDFVYEYGRPDHLVRYVNGLGNQQEARLSQVIVSVTGGYYGYHSPQTVGAYNLSYGVSSQSGRSLLRSIQYCDANSKCIPATTFRYTSDGSLSQAVSHVHEDVLINGSNYAVAANDAEYNFANNGQLDLIRGVEKWLSETEFLVFDADADGNDDIVLKHWSYAAPGGYLQEQVYTPVSEDHYVNSIPRDLLLLADGAGGFRPPVELDPEADGVWGDQCAHEQAEIADIGMVQVIDMNGDGRNELLAPMRDECPFPRVHPRSHGTCERDNLTCGDQQIGDEFHHLGDEQYQRWAVLAFDSALGTLTNVPFSEFNARSWVDTRYSFADVDGDGLRDLFSTTNSPEADGIQRQWWLRFARAEASSSGDFMQYNGLRSTFLSSFPEFEYVGPPVEVVGGRPFDRIDYDLGLWQPNTFVQAIDTDGDGREELRRQVNNVRQFGLSWRVYPGFIQPEYGRLNNHTVTTELADAPPDWWDEGRIQPGNMNFWTFLDINGDGLKDALVPTLLPFEPNPNPWPAEMRLVINAGAGFLPPQDLGIPVLDEMAFAMSDPNNYMWPPGQPRGLRFFRRASDLGIRVVDWNGDGLDDLIVFEPEVPGIEDGLYLSTNAPVRVLLSNGRGFQPIADVPGTENLRRLYSRFRGWPTAKLGDIDGDDMADIIMLTAATDTNGNTTRRVTVVRRSVIDAEGQRVAGGPDKVVSVRDLRGTMSDGVDYLAADVVNERVTYGEIAPPGFHVSDARVVPGSLADTQQAQPCGWPARCLTKGAVVERYENFVHARKVDSEYQYHGGRVDVTGRGSLGFRRVEILDRITSRKTTLEYDQSHVGSLGRSEDYWFHFYPQTQPVRTTTVSPRNAPVGSDLVDPEGPQVTETTLHQRRFAPLSGRVLRLVDDETTSQVVAGTAPRALYSDFNLYDEYGNETYREEYAGDLLSGEFTRRTRETEYDIREDSWLVGLPEYQNVGTHSNVSPYGAGDLALSHLSLYSFDERGLLEERTDAFGDPRLEREDTFVYDAAGVLRFITQDAIGEASRTSAIDWDAVGVHPKAVQNAEGHVTWLRFHDRFGKPLLITDPNAVSTYFAYDGFGRLRLTRADGSATTTFNYGHLDGAGHRGHFDDRMRAQTVTTSESTGAMTVNLISARGLSAGTLSRGFDGGPTQVETNYDSLGNLVAVRYRGPSNTLPTPGTPATAWPSHHYQDGPGYINISGAAYDALSRLVRSVTYDVVEGSIQENEITRAYPTFDETLIRDEVGRETRLKKDVLGRTIRREEILNGEVAATSYAYDPRGPLASVATADGTTLRFYFDRRGNLEERQSSDGGQRDLALQYNGFGEIERLIDPVSDITFERDRLGRVLARTATTPSGLEVQEFSWDNGIAAIGQLTAAVTSDGHATAYAYDSFGRRSRIVHTFGENISSGQVLSFAVEYDADGRVETLHYPETDSADTTGRPSTGGLSVRYEYANGHLSKIWDANNANTPLWEVLDRHNFGMVTAANTQHGVFEYTRYNDYNLRQEYRGIDGPNADHSLSYAYQNDGRIREKLWSAPASSLRESFTYDGLGRLEQYLRQTAVDSSPVVAGVFANDLVGNVSSVEFPANPGRGAYYDYSQSVPSQLERLRINQANPDVARVYEHDAAGRVVSENLTGAGSSNFERTYAYNSFDLLSSVVQVCSAPGGWCDAGFTQHQWEFRYDAFGARVRKHRAPDENVFYVEGLYELRDFSVPTLVDSDRRTTHAIYRVMGDEGPVAEIIHDWSTNQRRISFLHLEADGSIAHRTEAGQPTRELGHNPYGLRRPVAAVGSTAGIGFTGHEHDDDLGLINMKGRHYSIFTRRFLTQDPLIVPEAAGGMNPYSYALNDPINLVDPTGLSVQMPPTFIAPGPGLPPTGGGQGSCGGGPCGQTQGGGYPQGYSPSPAAPTQPTGGVPTTNRPPPGGPGSGAYGGSPFASTFSGGPGASAGNPSISDGTLLPQSDRGSHLAAIPRGVQCDATCVATGGGLGPGSFMAGGAKVGAVGGKSLLQRVLSWLGFRAVPTIGKTLNEAVGKGAANVVREVLKGRQPLSALSAGQRTSAAAFYRDVATRATGREAAAASQYNIARAEFLEGTRPHLSPTLPEFIKNGF